MVMKRLFLYMLEDGDPGNCTDSFKVFRLDLEAKTDVQIESIGDYALFMGLDNSVCLPTTAGCKRCKRNCVYYTVIIMMVCKDIWWEKRSSLCRPLLNGFVLNSYMDWTKERAVSYLFIVSL